MTSFRMSYVVLHAPSTNVQSQLVDHREKRLPSMICWMFNCFIYISVYATGNNLCYSLTQSNHVPVLCRVVVVFTRYSTSTFTQFSFVLRSNQALIPSIGLLPSGRIKLYYVLNAQMPFSSILYHTAKRMFWIIWFIFRCFFGLSAYLTENQGVTHSEQEYYACAMYKADREIIEERDRK